MRKSKRLATLSATANYATSLLGKPSKGAETGVNLCPSLPLLKRTGMNGTLRTYLLVSLFQRVDADPEPLYRS